MVLISYEILKLRTSLSIHSYLKSKSISNHDSTDKPNVTEEVYDGSDRIVKINGNQYDREALHSDASYPIQYFHGPSVYSLHEKHGPSGIVTYGDGNSPDGHATGHEGHRTSHDKKKAIRTKDESAHDKRTANEKQLKERTEIEFFERGS